MENKLCQGPENHSRNFVLDRKNNQRNNKRAILRQAYQYQATD